MHVYLIEDVVQQVLAARLSLLPWVNKQGDDCVAYTPQLQAVPFYTVDLEEKGCCWIIELFCSSTQHHLHTHWVLYKLLVGHCNALYAAAAEWCHFQLATQLVSHRNISLSIGQSHLNSMNGWDAVR